MKIFTSNKYCTIKEFFFFLLLSFYNDFIWGGWIFVVKSVFHIKFEDIFIDKIEYKKINIKQNMYKKIVKLKGKKEYY